MTISHAPNSIDSVTIVADYDGAGLIFFDTREFGQRRTDGLGRTIVRRKESEEVVHSGKNAVWKRIRTYDCDGRRGRGGAACRQFADSVIVENKKAMPSASERCAYEFLNERGFFKNLLLPLLIGFFAAYIPSRIMRPWRKLSNFVILLINIALIIFVWYPAAKILYKAGPYDHIFAIIYWVAMFIAICSVCVSVYPYGVPIVHRPIVRIQAKDRTIKPRQPQRHMPMDIKRPDAVRIQIPNFDLGVMNADMNGGYHC